MAYSKTFLLVGLLFAVVLIMASEVSARELAETARTRLAKGTVEDGYSYGKGKGYSGKGKGYGGKGKGKGKGKPPSDGADDVEGDTDGDQN